MIGSFLRRFGRDDRGLSTVEFAIVAPSFLMMTIGGMHLSMMGFTASALHYAAEAGARCWAIQTVTCTSQTSAETYARARFTNISGVTPTFTGSTTTCGLQMEASLTYVIKTGVGSVSVPLSATACYPN